MNAMGISPQHSAQYQLGSCLTVYSCYIGPYYGGSPTGVVIANLALPHTLRYVHSMYIHPNLAFLDSKIISCNGYSRYQMAEEVTGVMTEGFIRIYLLLY